MADKNPHQDVDGNPIFPGPILGTEVEHDLLPGEDMKGDEVKSNDPNVRITLESGVYHWQPTSPSGGIARIHPGQPSQEQLAAWYVGQQAREDSATATGGVVLQQFSTGKDGTIKPAGTVKADAPPKLA